MYTFPQIILNKAGNSYLSTSSKYLAHKDLQAKLKDIISSKKDNDNRYFVFEIKGNEAIIRAIQTNIKQAVYYFNNGNNLNRLIVHFDKHFFNCCITDVT